jgi:hypothetical protein
MSLLEVLEAAIAQAARRAEERAGSLRLADAEAQAALVEWLDHWQYMADGLAGRSAALDQMASQSEALVHAAEAELAEVETLLSRWVRSVEVVEVTP